MHKLIAFLVISCALVIASRKALMRPRSHGFPRFFAWELMAALFVLNARMWFRDPWSWHQLISWALLFGCLVPLVAGSQRLFGHGKIVKERPGDEGLFSFEKTSQLVTTGIYRYIRHPLYGSLLMLAWGIFFKRTDWLGLALAALASVFLYWTARADEAECIAYFGDEYREYMKRSKRFVPFVF